MTVYLAFIGISAF